MTFKDKIPTFRRIAEAFRKKEPEAEQKTEPVEQARRKVTLGRTLLYSGLMGLGISIAATYTGIKVYDKLRGDAIENQNRTRLIQLDQNNADRIRKQFMLYSAGHTDDYQRLTKKNADLKKEFEAYKKAHRISQVSVQKPKHATTKGTITKKKKGMMSKLAFWKSESKPVKKTVVPAKPKAKVAAKKHVKPAAVKNVAPQQKKETVPSVQASTAISTPTAQPKTTKN
jgi:hypothetical protein